MRKRTRVNGVVNPPPRKTAAGLAGQYVNNRLLDDAGWAEIVAVYARFGGRTAAVAQALGWNVAKARQVYKRGYPRAGFPPVEAVLAADAAAAEEVRAARQKLEHELAPSYPVTRIEQVIHVPEVVHAAEATRIRQLVEREQTRLAARADAVDSRAAEAMLIKINRKNALALNGVTSQILAGAMKLSGTIEKDLAAAAEDGGLTVSEKLHLLRSAANIARFNSETTMLAVKAERMVLGSPIEADPETVTDGTLDQAVEWIEASIKAVNRARARGLLTGGSSA